MVFDPIILFFWEQTERALRGGALCIVEAGDRTAQAPIRLPSCKRLAYDFASKLDLPAVAHAGVFDYFDG